ncbi:aminoglycoside phosphotransferase family protein [Streptomyces sp. PA03-3a]|nr:aminoglycoside phosphotransferase family protein [Streptomyces sp. PA03-3a]
MTSATYDFAWRIAIDVVGPLEGHHHEAYAVELGPDSDPVLRAQFPWLKLRVPLAHVVRYDHRCFRSEEELLVDLEGKIQRVPKVVDLGRDADAPANVTFVQFVKGRTLEDVTPPRMRVSRRHAAQIIDLFRALASLDPAEIRAERICGNGPSSSGAFPRSGGDAATFLRNLIRHTARVYREKPSDLNSLFSELRIPDDLLDRLPDELGPMTPRPFALLHGDLHRRNLVVDDARDLWAIDWELARVGDPLYDLATHLHLMQYPRWQSAHMTWRWVRAMKKCLPDAVHGVSEDLPRYLAFKRIQSAYTDLMRGATKLATSVAAGTDLLEALNCVVPAVTASLTAARFGQDGTGLGNVGLREVASPEEVRRALTTWYVAHGAARGYSGTGASVQGAVEGAGPEAARREGIREAAAAG